MGYSGKKQTGRGVINNEVEFPEAIKKKSCVISWGLGFRPQRFPRSVITKFLEFLGVKLFI